MKTKEYYEYLQQRKAMNKTNYYLESMKELDEIHQKFTDHKPRLLLHACCAVCAGWPLEFLYETFDITVYYANSNIWPREEYERRLNEIRRYLKEVYDDRINLIVPPYDNAEYTLRLLKSHKDDPEGFHRCFICYAARMKEAYAYACENGYDYMTTVLSSSRQKDSQKINEIGHALSKQFPNTAYFYSDFKKKGGQQRRDELASEHNLYRQDYCGCVYSWEERFLNNK